MEHFGIISGYILLLLGYLVGVKGWLFVFSGYHREACSDAIPNKPKTAYRAGALFVCGAIAVSTLSVIFSYEAARMAYAFLFVLLIACCGVFRLIVAKNSHAIVK